MVGEPLDALFDAPADPTRLAERVRDSSERRS
jgi:hypothetical protein